MATRLRVVGVLMVLGGLGLIAGGVAGLVVTGHEQVATAAELETYNARLMKDIMLVAGGLLAGAAGGQVWRAARRWQTLNRLGRMLLISGCLAVAAGLAVFTRSGSVGGSKLGFGLQAVGAVAVGVSGSAVRRDRGPRSSQEPAGH